MKVGKLGGWVIVLLIGTIFFQSVSKTNTSLTVVSDIISLGFLIALVTWIVSKFKKEVT